MHGWKKQRGVTARKHQVKAAERKGAGYSLNTTFVSLQSFGQVPYLEAMWQGISNPEVLLEPFIIPWNGCLSINQSAPVMSPDQYQPRGETDEDRKVLLKDYMTQSEDTPPDVRQ